MSPVQPNGTHAGEIARHFVKATGIRVTSSIMGKTVNQAKKLLDAGFTKAEIIASIDHVVDQGIEIYSLGFLDHCIDRCLREIKQKQIEEENRIMKEEFERKKAEEQHAIAEEVKVDVESAKRNREKADRLRSSVQSRVREKFNFDMFEE